MPTFSVSAICDECEEEFVATHDGGDDSEVNAMLVKLGQHECEDEEDDE